MNSSFPNRWSFSYLKFTKYVTNIIAEPKYKYRHQEQVTVRNHNRSTALERSVEIELQILSDTLSQDLVSNCTFNAKQFQVSSSNSLALKTARCLSTHMYLLSFYTSCCTISRIMSRRTLYTPSFAG